MMPAEAYRKMPTDQATTASMASGRRPASTNGSIDAAATATDWLDTTQMNQVPFAAATTGRELRPSTAVQGTTYPSTSQKIPETTSRTAVVRYCPSIASRAPTTLVPATKVKNPNARRGSVKSSRMARGNRTIRDSVRSTSTA